MYTCVVLLCSLVAPTLDDAKWATVPVSKIKPGLVAELGSPGDRVDPKGGMVIAFDPFAWQAVEKSVAANDLDGIRELIKAKRAGQINYCTDVKVLEYRRDGLVEVRVMSGDLKSRRGYVPSRFICERN